MYYVTYSKLNNSLVCVSGSPIDYDPNYLNQETRDGDPPNVIEYEWNPSLLNFDKKATVEISRIEFLMKFSLVERLNIRQLEQTDPMVMDIMEMVRLAEFINLRDRNVSAGLGYLTYIGVLTEHRLQEILN